MDARTSRYPEVYARWQRDPQAFWAEAARRPSIGSRRPSACSIPMPAYTGAGSSMASATPAGTRSTGT
jgi:hypothetical protein